MKVYMILLSLTTVTMVSGRSASFNALDRRLLKELLDLYENEVTGQEDDTDAEKRAQLPACGDLGKFNDFQYVGQPVRQTLKLTVHVEYLVKLIIRNENCSKSNSIVNEYKQTANTFIDIVLQDAVHPRVRFFCREHSERIYYRTYFTYAEYYYVDAQLWDKLLEAHGSYPWGSYIYKVSDNVIDRCFDMRSLLDKSIQCFQVVLDMQFKATAVCYPARYFLYCLGTQIEKASNEPLCEADVLDNHEKRIQLLHFLNREFPQNKSTISQLGLYDAETCATDNYCC